MFTIKKDFSKMGEADKRACVDALRRILNPGKGLHLVTLVTLTRDQFAIEEEEEGNDK